MQAEHKFSQALVCAKLIFFYLPPTFFLLYLLLLCFMYSTASNRKDRLSRAIQIGEGEIPKLTTSKLKFCFVRLPVGLNSRQSVFVVSSIGPERVKGASQQLQIW